MAASGFEWRHLAWLKTSWPTMHLHACSLRVSEAPGGRFPELVIQLWIYWSAAADNWIKLREQFEKFLKSFWEVVLDVTVSSPLEFQTSNKATFQILPKQKKKRKKDLKWIIPFNTLTKAQTHEQMSCFLFLLSFFSGKRKALINVTLWTRIPWCRDWRHDSHKAPSQTATCHRSILLFSSRCGMRMIPRSGKKKGRTLPRCLFSVPLAITQLYSFLFHRSNHS